MDHGGDQAYSEVYKGISILEKMARNRARKAPPHKAMSIDLSLTALLAILQAIIAQLEEQ